MRYSSSDTLSGVIDVLEAARDRASAAAGAPPPCVLLCLGHARWGYSQIQNECLRGDWGVNPRGACAELLAAAPLAHSAYAAEASGTSYVRPPPDGSQ